MISIFSKSNSLSSYSIHIYLKCIIGFINVSFSQQTELYSEQGQIGYEFYFKSVSPLNITNSINILLIINLY